MPAWGVAWGCAPQHRCSLGLHPRVGAARDCHEQPLVFLYCSGFLMLLPNCHPLACRAAQLWAGAVRPFILQGWTRPREQSCGAEGCSQTGAERKGACSWCWLHARQLCASFCEQTKARGLAGGGGAHGGCLCLLRKSTSGMSRENGLAAAFKPAAPKRCIRVP